MGWGLKNLGTNRSMGGEEGQIRNSPSSTSGITDPRERTVSEVGRQTRVMQEESQERGGTLSQTTIDASNSRRAAPRQSRDSRGRFTSGLSV